MTGDPKSMVGTAPGLGRTVCADGKAGIAKARAALIAALVSGHDETAQDDEETE